MAMRIFVVRQWALSVNPRADHYPALPEYSRRTIWITWSSFCKKFDLSRLEKGAGPPVISPFLHDIQHYMRH
jgi:hypothetical protein